MKKYIRLLTVVFGVRAAFACHAQLYSDAGRATFCKGGTGIHYRVEYFHL